MRHREQVTPRGVFLMGSLAALCVLYPLLALAGRTPWASLADLATDGPNRTALVLSLVTAAIACVISTALGTALALVMAQVEGRWVVLLRALVLVPLVLPPVVSGITLLLAYGRAGPLAPLLSALDLQIVFTPAAVIFAQVFVSLPFVIVTVEGSARAQGFDLERTAASLGAGRRRVLATVTLPRLAPILLIAGTLAFTRSLGEFGATLSFAGSLEGRTRTLPLQIYLLRETSMEAAVGMSMVLVLFSLAVVTVAYARSHDARRPRESSTR